MTGHDTRDQEVRGYVRNRMAGEIPPEFVGNVMNDVHRTDQRRRNAAWPILTGLATVAAAAVLVVLGLNLLNRNGGVGAEATPTPSSTTASAEPSVSASAEASAEVTPSASAEASADEGAFGPTHSMAPEDAFDNAQTCENSGGITTVGEQTDIRYRISFPGGWFTSAGTDTWAACTLFAPERFEPGDDGSVPENVAITNNMPPGGDFSPGGSSVTTREYTVDGVAAVRYEIEPTDGGFVSDPTVVWIIAVAGALPAEGNDQPYLAVSASSADPAEFAERVDVLDRMIATFEFLGQ